MTHRGCRRTNHRRRLRTGFFATIWRRRQGCHEGWWRWRHGGRWRRWHTTTATTTATTTTTTLLGGARCVGAAATSRCTAQVDNGGVEGGSTRGGWGV